MAHDPIKHFLRVMMILAFGLGAVITAAVQFLSRG